MIRMFVFTTAVLLTSGTVVLAQVPPQPPPVANPLIGQGTEQERAACHPDVVKYCKELVKDNDQPDVFAILNQRPLSGSACRPRTVSRMRTCPAASVSPGLFRPATPTTAPRSNQWASTYDP